MKRTDEGSEDPTLTPTEGPTAQQDLGNEDTHDASRPGVALRDSAPAQPSDKYEVGEVAQRTLAGQSWMLEQLLPVDRAATAA
jgi:hypothetical protein